MAIYPRTLELKTNFICHTEQEASVRGKRDHTHTPMPWSATPYVRVEAYIGTHESACNRVGAHHYKGHVPEAPLMLGGNRTAEYRAAALTVDWGKPRMQAFLVAATAGVLLGLAAACLSAGVVLIALKLGMAGSLTLQSFACIALFDMVGFAIVTTAFEWWDYARASARFRDLATLSDGFDRLKRNEANEAVELACQRIVEKAYAGSEWSLRHAAHEYDEEKQDQLRKRQPAAA